MNRPIFAFCLLIFASGTARSQTNNPYQAQQRMWQQRMQMQQYWHSRSNATRSPILDQRTSEQAAQIQAAQIKAAEQHAAVLNRNASPGSARVQFPFRVRGRAIEVQDGDTFDLAYGTGVVRIRIKGIDAPEMGQVFGATSKRILQALLFNQTLDVVIVGQDQYQRYVSVVQINGIDLGLRMIKDGYAWNYVQFSDDPRYESAQQFASSRQRGLWFAAERVPPWVYRRQKSETTLP